MFLSTSYSSTGMSSTPRPTSASVALVTMYDASPAFACSVIHWCQHALRFANVLRKASTAQSLQLSVHLLVVVSCREKYVERAQRTLAQDCPEARMIRPEPELRAAAYRLKSLGTCQDRAFGWQFLLKWAVMKIVHSPLLIFADLDVELQRPEQNESVAVSYWTHAFDWTSLLPTRHHGAPSTQVRSIKDTASPVNTGVWSVLWPSVRLYDHGLQIMQNLTAFNLSHGFGLIGTPEELYRSRPRLRRRMTRTYMLRRNDWRFAGGDCDQGFFFYALYLHGDAGTSPDTLPIAGAVTSLDLNIEQGHLLPPARVHTARHFYDSPKPWQVTKCLAGIQKTRHLFSVRKLEARMDACDLASGPLVESNADRAAWWLRHTDYASRANRSKCAGQLARLASRLRAHNQLTAHHIESTPPLRQAGSFTWGVLHRVW